MLVFTDSFNYNYIPSSYLESDSPDFHLLLKPGLYNTLTPILNQIHPSFAIIRGRLYFPDGLSERTQMKFFNCCPNTPSTELIRGVNVAS